MKDHSMNEATQFRDSYLIYTTVTCQVRKTYSNDSVSDKQIQQA